MTSLLSPKKNYIEPLLIAEATRNLSSGTSIKCKKKKLFLMYVEFLSFTNINCLTVFGYQN